MRPLLSSELIKLRTTRTFYALAGVAIGLSLLFTILSAVLTDADEVTKESVLSDVFQSDVSGLFILILAIVGITGEWRHRTITSSLLAAPHRIRFLAAKTLAFMAAGALLSLAISIAIAVFGYVILGQRDLPTPELGDVVEQTWRNALVAALYGGIGVGVGALIRNQPTAIVTILILLLVVDSLLAWLVPEVARYSPTGALAVSVGGLDPENAGVQDVDLLDPAVAALAMLAWIGALFAAGAALLVSRDVE